MADNRKRSERNDVSRNKADHHAEPWTVYEDEFLQELWDRSEDGLTEVAEILGRTREACRERYYKVRRGIVTRGTYTLSGRSSTFDRPAWMDEEGMPDWYR